MYTLKLEREVLVSSKDQINEFVMPFKDKYITSVPQNRKLNSNFDRGSDSSMYYKYRASYF